MNEQKREQLIAWLERMPWWDELPYAKLESLVTGRVVGEWPDGFGDDPDDWEEWSLQLYGHEAGDLLLGQEAWDHIMRGLKRDTQE